MIREKIVTTPDAYESFAHVLKVTIFLTNLGNFRKVVKLRRKHFTKPYPGDTLVEISGLYTPEAMIEIEAIAAVIPSAS